MPDEPEAEAKHAGGRPTICTVALAEEIGERVVKGASILAACHAAGIAPQRLSDWAKKATEGKEPYTEFTDTLKRCLAEAVALAEMKIWCGGDGWQASARWLESMQRERWCRMERREVKDDRTPPALEINVELGVLLAAQGMELSAGPPAPGLRPLRDDWRPDTTEIPEGMLGRLVTDARGNRSLAPSPGRQGDPGEN